MQIILDARNADDSYIILHNFIWQHFHFRAFMVQGTHIYHISVSINRMLISQLKRFLGVQFMFPPQFNV